MIIMLPYNFRMLLPRAVAAFQRLAISNFGKCLTTTSYRSNLDNHIFTTFRRKRFHTSIISSFRDPKGISLKFRDTNTFHVRSTFSTNRNSTFDFEKDCEETLESLSERFEELLEGN